jgi:Domain of unknown function (DUF4386)
LTNRHAEVSRRQAARIAGYGYLAIFVLAIFANFFVRERLIEPDDAAATASNIIGSEALFRLGLVGFLVVFVLDLVIAWALYVLFRHQSRDISLLTAWFRLVYTSLLGVALLFLFLVLQVVSGADYLTAFQAAQLDAQVTLFLEGFDAAWLIGLVCFGIHLALLGSLVLTSGDIPKILGVLLILAGAGYVIDTLANALLANYGDYETAFMLIVALPSVIGEFAFTIWLLLRGGKERGALRTALETRA